MLNNSDYEYSPVVFNIYKIDDPNHIELISDGDEFRKWGHYSINHSDDHFTDFEVGKYLIEITICWNDYKYPLVLNYYSRNSINMK